MQEQGSAEDHKYIGYGIIPNSEITKKMWLKTDKNKYNKENHKKK